MDSTPALHYANDLQRDGYALVHAVLSPDVITGLTEEFTARYGHLRTSAVTPGEATEVGSGRYLITVPLSGVFADIRAYANPAVMEVMAIALDQDFVLDSFGVVLSLSGAETQHLHRDGSYLFGAGIAPILPVHAITVGIPLIDMNAARGTTELFPGSHRYVNLKDSDVSVAPEVPAGSCVMWDFRLLHRGTENRSADWRPLLYMTYSKPWWRDSKNYALVWEESGPTRPQERIKFGEKFFQSVPLSARSLFRNFGT